MKKLKHLRVTFLQYAQERSIAGAWTEELKEDFRVRNQITPEKHMARLNELHEMAKSKGQLHTAMNAEVYRGKMAGYYVERQLVKSGDDLTVLTEDQLWESVL